jgi:hypothetical protein
MVSKYRLASAIGSLVLAAAPLLGPPGAAAQPAPQRGCEPLVAFQASDFSNPTRIDNQWLPLTPGTRMTLEGRAIAGGQPLPHQIIFTVTDLTKTIAGVRTVVLYDVDVQDGEQAEAELAFHAQDDRGNVWGLGEYPEEYDDGHFAGAPKTWITGVADAMGGLAIISDPKLGSPRYLQGRVPSIEFLDCAQVYAMDESVCVPLQCYDHVLVTDETSPLASGKAHQRKFYAPGVGNVMITPIDDPEGEALVLTSVETLSPDALAQARADALKLDSHAYQVSQLYSSTPPASPADNPG